MSQPKKWHCKKVFVFALYLLVCKSKSRILQTWTSNIYRLKIWPIRSLCLCLSVSLSLAPSLSKSSTGSDKDNYGFNTVKCPSSVKELGPYEKDMMDVIKNFEFKRLNNKFQLNLRKDKYVEATTYLYRQANVGLYKK